MLVSVVIPAYNETSRLPPYLAVARAYLDRQYREAYEVIVVDDGSTDGLAVVLDRLQRGWPQLRLITHAQNRGKGAAVRTGVLAAQGEMVLFTDADGATPIEQERALRQAIGAGSALAVGSRLVGNGRSGAVRKWHRGLCGMLFALIIRASLRVRVRDTQCGFKLFPREVGQRLFRLCQESGYLFDVELIGRAEQLGYQVAEVGVPWKEVTGSKVRLWRDGWAMLWGLRKIRRLLQPPPASGPGPRDAFRPLPVGIHSLADSFRKLVFRKSPGSRLAERAEAVSLPGSPG